MIHCCTTKSQWVIAALATVGMAWMTMCGCTRNRQRTIMPAGLSLKTGDVMLRRGSGMTSRAVLMADHGGGYSHIGIAVDSAGVMMVVHAVPGEPDYEGDPDRVKMEPVDKFYARENAVTGGVMRCTDSVAAMRAAQVALEIYRRGTLFDHEYDDSDTTKMYCCELVEFAYKRAGITLAVEPRHNFDLLGMKLRNVIMPSDFISSPRLKSITNF